MTTTHTLTRTRPLETDADGTLGSDHYSFDARWVARQIGWATPDTDDARVIEGGGESGRPAVEVGDAVVVEAPNGTWIGEIADIDWMNVHVEWI